MAKKEITFTNWVTLEGKPVKVSDLPLKMQQALGNRVMSEPLRALGYIVEPILDENREDKEL